MKFYAEDHAVARAYEATELSGFPRLAPAQREQIRAHARDLRAAYRAHPRLHNAASVALLAGLFALDALCVLALPRHLPWDPASTRGALLAGLVAGALHGLLVCSIVTYTVHEGAAHDLIIQGDGPAARALRLLANNACRLFLADPEYYAAGHLAHHRAFGTPEDPSFTSHVRPRRLLLALLPLAPVLSLSDFFPWRPQEHTRSRTLSAVLTNAYVALFAVLAYQRYGALYAVVALLLVGAWVSFVLDRLRESTEHVFLPLDRDHGTRDLGLGFWGLVLGGGPWGQPCHLSHHLAPALPWYQQLRLHAFLHGVLTAEQKRAFFPRPVVGVPAILWRVFSATDTPRARVRPAAPDAAAGSPR